MAQAYVDGVVESRNRDFEQIVAASFPAPTLHRLPLEEIAPFSGSVL
ncbi:MAG TPA: hypothetical protein VKB79_29680 [Bryobacteraceae bacterium]|nr:hypothetical protein [Bryobacteraceae bacterium]